VQGAFPVLKTPGYVPAILKEITFISVNSHPVIWIETYHPRHSGFHITNRPHYTLYEHAIREFFQDKSTFSIEPLMKESLIPVTVNLKPRTVGRSNSLYGNRKDHMDKENTEFVIGYLELPEYPDFPSQKFPTKADCEGYEYITMVQLCNIAEKHGRGRPSACNAFGGDKGNRPVAPERQARIARGHRPWKFVLVNAAEKYFAGNWYRLVKENS